MVSETASKITGTKDAAAGWRQRRLYTPSANMSGAAVFVTELPSGNEYIVVDDLIISVDTAMSVALSEESGSVFETIYLAANSTVQVTTRGKLVVQTKNKRMKAQSSGAGNIAITTLFHSDPDPFHEV